MFAIAHVAPSAMPRKPRSRVVKPATSPEEPTGPFTREMVHALLREVLKGSGPLPNPDRSTVAHFVRYLNLLWWRVQGWTGPWSEREMVASSIRFLTEVLPPLRKDYAAAAAPPKWNIKGAANAAANARADLAAFDALANAARVARKRSLLLTFNMMLATSKPTRRWQDFAADLQEAIRGVVPKASKAAVYELIVAVVPYITGKRPTYFAVETELKHPERQAEARS